MENRQGKIIVIDDIRTDLNLIGKLLESFGYEAVLCNSAKEGESKLDTTFDLIIIDALMPGMSGFEYVRKIKSHTLLGHIPVIMVTSLSERSDRIKAVEAGISDYITKPVDRLELKVRVSSMLKMKIAQDRVRNYQAELEKLVAKKTKDLSQALFKLQTVLDGINDIMIMVDRKGNITEVNFALIKLTGKSENELKVNLADLITPDQFEKFSELIEAKTIIQRDIEFEQWGNRTFSILATPIENSNILMMRDITEKRKAAMQRERFLSILSHELRTPLNGILVTTELMLEEFKNKDFTEELMIIQESGKNLEKTVHELMNFLETSVKDSANQEKVNIYEIIIDTFVKYKNKCDEKNIDFNFSDEVSDREVEITAVPSHINEIFRQIIDNSVKFSNENGFINVVLKKDETHIIVCVTDNGCGIPEDKQPHIFESFFQAQDFITREKEGLGLGLTIAQRLMENYNGTIEVKSRENEGTKVILKFPF